MFSPSFLDSCFFLLLRGLGVMLLVFIANEDTTLMKGSLAQDFSNLPGHIFGLYKDEKP